MIAPKPNRPLDILLAYDGSQHALAAAELLLDLPLPAGSSVYAVAVVTPGRINEHSLLQAGLDWMQCHLKEKGISVKTELLLGYPAEKVIEAAKVRNPHLIVVGAKGLRASLGILLGGVAQQIVEYARWPVLVVRAPYKQLKRVLLVTDGSACSRQAAVYLGHFPWPADIQVRVMNVLPPAPGELIPSWPPGAEILTPFQPVIDREAYDWQEEDECRGREILDLAIKTLHSYGVEARSVLTRGDAATEIIEYSKKHEIDLVLAGSRGLSVVQSWLLGSVSRKLIHYSGRSVLVVKDRACQPVGESW